MTKDELIAALEAAAGPSRELDVAIVYALYPDIGPYASHCAGDPPIFWFDPYYKQECPLFTASIDAALTLVPEGMGWSVNDYTPTGGDGGAFIHPSSPAECIHALAASTPAIALCIAALRARP